MTRITLAIHLFRATCLAAALTGFATSAMADTIYSNGSFPPPVAGAVFGEAGGAAADNFTLSPGQTTIGEIHFWGLYNIAPPGGSHTDSFTINIHNNQIVPGDFPNRPGTIAASIDILSLDRSATGQVASFDDVQGNPAPIYKYTAAISPVTLAANTSYWLSISNSSGLYWGWLADDGGDAHYYNNFLGQWSSAQVDLESPSYSTIFYLTDEIHNVPEPSSAVLALAAITGLALFRRRKA